MILPVPHDREQQRRKRVTFDDVAAGYEARPPYPDAVYDRLTTRHGAGPGCDVLEIGPGTGQLTLPLLQLGCRVTAVELGANLSARLAERADGQAADLDIVTSSFEDARLPEASFDLVLSATAFHWVDPEVGIPKACALLRPGGWFVLVWNIFGDPDRADPFHDALFEMLERLEPDLALPYVPGSTGPDGASWTSDIDGHGLFEPAAFEVIRWTGTHSTAELRALFATFSTWISRGPEGRAVLLDELATIADEEFGGQVSRPYQTLIVSARKPAAPPT
jgi:SAM-dependent methyltransferase